MTDDAIQQATLAKQASRETSRIRVRVILTAWEIEEAERHVELLQRTNIEIYKEANDEASWFENESYDRTGPWQKTLTSARHATTMIWYRWPTQMNYLNSRTTLKISASLYPKMQGT